MNESGFDESVFEFRTRQLWNTRFAYFTKFSFYEISHQWGMNDHPPFYQIELIG